MADKPFSASLGVDVIVSFPFFGIVGNTVFRSIKRRKITNYGTSFGTGKLTDIEKEILKKQMEGNYNGESRPIS
jgi:hypothetical protein